MEVVAPTEKVRNSGRQALVLVASNCCWWRWQPVAMVASEDGGSDGHCYVPGLAFKQGLPYIQLEDSDLMNSASTFAQLEFYKKAVFIGCKSGEIELGSLTANNANIQMLFNQDFINFQRSQPQLGDLLLPDQNILSSSSTSSLKSLSVGSPEYTSFILSNPATDQSGSDQALKQGKPLTSHHQITMDSFNLYRNILLPSPQSDDAALTRAILAVLSSPQKDVQQQEESRVTQASSSFQPFGSITASFEPNLRLQGQRMIKKSISLLRKMYSLKHAETRRHERLPISSKLHHVMAERKRRVRINESLRDLRMLLPPGSKKDYVTVLSNTKDYLRTLKVQINELEERNRKLEMVLKSNKQPAQVTDSNERVEIQVIRASESTSESQQIYLLIIVREEVNMIDFLLKVLECLKRMGIMNMTTIDASSNPTMASLTLQVQVWDITSFFFPSKLK
ncbi:hypothetical protein IEQ34_003466 [Dendrobium chrysotoxum]|uniref:BHLH domain-containing protein n=1 Tax=Dendrobium chrysotoxum TaxID=161865 RepID=A0AAV7HK06_DENCH|nr:hypothetical protein IEQ34_003466 [Dendrobium chrysotoxum]